MLPAYTGYTRHDSPAGGNYGTTRGIIVFYPLLMHALINHKEKLTARSAASAKATIPRPRGIIEALSALSIKLLRSPATGDSEGQYKWKHTHFYLGAFPCRSLRCKSTDTWKFIPLISFLSNQIPHFLYASLRLTRRA